MTPPTNAASARKWLWLLLTVAVVVRLVDFPPRYQYRQIDEQSYVAGGLALWEGITPNYKYAPAGPQTWISWGYAAFWSGWHLAFPGAWELSQPGVLRPFAASSHALFDIYRDWSMLRQIDVAANDIIAVLAVAAGFGLGMKRGGLPAAILVGGLTAVLPIFVEIGGEGRPYMMAWGMGIIALYYSASSEAKPARPITSALWMGLAISSRIDMLLLLPLAWSDIWHIAQPKKFRRICKYTIIALVTMQFVSPWVMTNLIGNLRIIATVRLAPPTHPVSIGDTITGILTGQGLWLVIIMVLIFACWPKVENKMRWGVGIYTVILMASMLKATGFDLQHQGGPLVAIIAVSAMGMGILVRRPRSRPRPLVAIALILPAIQCVHTIYNRRHLPTPMATQWIESHVPAGTTVYLTGEIRQPIPTRQSADAIWDEVADPDAWRKKEQSALNRFHSGSDDLPRAFSEENMIIERGNRRWWFMLGGGPGDVGPRYDVKIWGNGLFGVGDAHAAAAAFQKTGGVLVVPNDSNNLDAILGPPKIQWTNARGQGEKVFVSSDVKVRE